MPEVDLVQATLPAQAAMGPAVTQAWMPIETAPMDGTRILIKTVSGSHWDDKVCWCWVAYSDGKRWKDESTWDEIYEVPISWAPLPTEDAQVTADCVPAGTRAQLEPNTSLLTQVAELREALEKFARAAKAFDGTDVTGTPFSDDQFLFLSTPSGDAVVATIGDLRRARAALNKAEGRS